MRKGSLVVRCSRCGKEIGWIDSGKRNPRNGQELYEVKLDSGVKVIKNSFGDYYWCGCKGVEAD